MGLKTAFTTSPFAGIRRYPLFPFVMRCRRNTMAAPPLHIIMRYEVAILIEFATVSPGLDSDRTIALVYIVRKHSANEDVS